MGILTIKSILSIYNVFWTNETNSKGSSSYVYRSEFYYSDKSSIQNLSEFINDV